MAKTKEQIEEILYKLRLGYREMFGEDLADEQLKSFAAKLLLKRQIELIENRLGDLGAEDAVKLNKVLEEENA